MTQKLILAVLAVLSIALNEVQGNTRFFLRPPIISGQDAYLGQFPWQVILKKDVNNELLCGGSIISNNWVLTAAHCTFELPSVLVSVGTVDRDDLKNYQIVDSSRIYVHPDYKASYLANDVSLINLPTPLVFNSYVQPIRLNTNTGDSLAGEVATIVGFGVMDDENLEYSENMKYAAMLIRSNDVCSSIYPDDYITANTICAEPLSGNQNICSGDSGGPLIIQDQVGYIQVGINSFVVEDECTESYPSGFVKISSFIVYISGVTGLNF